MNNYSRRLQPKAFAVVNDVFSEEEIEELLLTISAADKTKETFRKTDDLFAIRRFFKEVPSAIEKIFTPHFTQLLKALFGDEFFVVKSIYFDKPPTSNWFVAYHQDLTISVDRKSDVEGFGPWTTKPGQFAVQPPLSILEDNVTVRIHLDDTTEENGALKVISGSHRNGIRKADRVVGKMEMQMVCNVQKGGILFMKPLLLHASVRTTNGTRRRVVHVELSRSTLPQPLQWAEHLRLPFFA